MSSLLLYLSLVYLLNYVHCSFRYQSYHQCLDSAWANAQCPFKGGGYQAYEKSFHYISDDKRNDTWKYNGVFLLKHTCFASPYLLVLSNLLDMKKGALTPLPTIKLAEKYNLPTEWGHGDFIYGGGGLDFPQFNFRYASPADHHPDLRSPKFQCATCATLLVITSLWFQIFADWSYRTMTMLHVSRHMLPKNPLFVINTAGLKIPEYIKFHLRAYGANFDIISLEELGSELNAGYRCFETVYLVSFFTYGWYVNVSVYEPFQHVLDFYREEDRRRQSGFLGSIGLGESGFPVPKGTKARDLKELRIVVSSRNSPHARSLLNVREVLQWCENIKGRFREQGFERAHCLQHGFGKDLLQDLKVMARSTVLICVHGSEAANAAYMPEGSALFEVLPFEFVHWAKEYHYKSLNVDVKVYPFVLRTSSQGHHEPGFFEKRNIGIPFLWPRDRHTKINITALDILMRRYVRVRSKEDYIQLREKGLVEVDG